MKKILILTTLILLSYTVKAQFFNESVRWKEVTIAITTSGEQFYFFNEYSIKGKTKIEGKEYFNLYCENLLRYYIRETQDQKVYVYHPEIKKVFLLYDFDFKKDKVIPFLPFHKDSKLESLKIDEVGFEKLLDGKNYEYAHANSKSIDLLKIIKGVGSTNGFLYHMNIIQGFSNRNTLLYEFYKNDVLIYNCPKESFVSDIKNDEENNQVTVYPQPARDNITFKFKAEGAEELRIYNSKGVLIKTYNVSNISSFKVEELLQSGVYFYTVQYKKGKTLSGKFIIKN